MPVPLVAAGAAVAGGAAAGGAAAGGAAAGGAVAAGTAGAAAGTAGAAAGTAGAATTSAVTTSAATTAGEAATEQVVKEGAKEAIKNQAKDKFEQELKDRLVDELKNKKSKDDEEEEEKKKTQDDDYSKLKKGEKLREKADSEGDAPNKGDDSKDGTKNAAKDAAKEVGKNLASKAGGVAISAVSGGVIPPKAGEFVTKKALDAGDKAIQNAKNKQNKNQNTNNNSPKDPEPQENNDSNQEKDLKEDDDLEQVEGRAPGKGGKSSNKLKGRRKRLIITIAAIGVVFFAVLVLVGMLASFIQIFLPGSFGDVKDKKEVVTYSKRDTKVLKKLNDLAAKYPNADASYVMAVVAYPYYDLLNNETLKKYVDTNKKTEDDSKESEEDVDSDELLLKMEDVEEGESQESESSGQNGGTQDEEIENDMYLNLFTKLKYRNKFEDLLKQYNGDQEAFNNYLKSTYFNEDSGYKKLLRKVNDEDVDSYKDDILKDILGNDDFYENYIKEQCVNNVSFQSAGQISAEGKVGDTDIKEIIKSGNIYVDVKESSCTTTNYNSMRNCASIDGSPFTLKEFALGSAFSEIGALDGTYDEGIIKAQIVASKSYLLGRPVAMNPSHVKNGWRVEKTSDGKYIYTIRRSRDSSFCSIRTGCGNRSALSKENQAKMDKFWEETKDFYVWDNTYKVPFAPFITNDSYSSALQCYRGSCLFHDELPNYTGQTYDKILAAFYSDNSRYSFVTTQTGDSYAAVVGNNDVVCNAANGNGLGIPDNAFKFYYQYDYPNVAFCGATSFSNSCAGGSNSICSFGCGVTSFAMLISNLSSDTSFDPPKASDEAKNNGGCAVGYGSNDSLFTQIGKKHEGFSYKVIPTNSSGANEVVNTIKNGGLVAANVQSASPFTSGGHWILIRGLTEDGKVKVADPISSKRSLKGTYDANEFISGNWLNGHSWIAIYGPRSEEIKKANQAAEQGDGVSTGNFSFPIKGMNRPSCSDYPRYSSGSLHTGTDISAPVGTEVLAVDGGTVVTSKDLLGCDGRRCVGGYYSYGRYIEIKHSNGLSSVYAHLTERKVNVGDKVSKGQVIGISGENGNTYGPHLHFEVRVNGSHSNPCNYFR